MIERIDRLTPETPPVWGKMNANQMICHLTDQLRHALNEKENPSSSTFFFRTIGKFLVLYVFPIPKHVKTSPKADQMIDGTKPVDFESDRELLKKYIEKLAETAVDFDWGSHFRFGPMNKREWNVFSHKHIDHHLRQFGI